MYVSRKGKFNQVCAKLGIGGKIRNGSKNTSFATGEGRSTSRITAV